MKVTSWGELGNIATAMIYGSGPFDEIINVKGVYVGVLRNAVDKSAIFSLRGTDNVKDFIVDAAAAAPYVTGRGWTTPYGFWIGIPEVFPIMRKMVGPGWSIGLVGHSLGAIRACNLAGEFAVNGITVSLLLTLGCPEAELGDELGALLAPIPLKLNLRNDDDPIGLQPPWAKQCVPRTQVSIPRPKPPTPLDALIYPYAWPLGDHDSALYATAAKQHQPQIVVLTPAIFTEKQMEAQASNTGTPSLTVSTAAHLTGLQELAADISALKAKFLSLFGVAVQVQEKALPVEVALAQVGAAAAGAPAAVGVIGEAGAAAEALNATGSALEAPVTPTNAAGVLESINSLAQATQATVTAATGKPASAQIVAAEGALGAAAAITAQAGAAPTPAAQP